MKFCPEQKARRVSTAIEVSQYREFEWIYMGTNGLFYRYKSNGDGYMSRGGSISGIVEMGCFLYDAAALRSSASLSGFAAQRRAVDDSAAGS